MVKPLFMLIKPKALKAITILNKRTKGLEDNKMLIVANKNTNTI